MRRRPSLLRLASGAFFLDPDAYAKMRDDAQRVSYGFALVLAIGALVGAAQAVGRLAEWAFSPNLSRIQTLALSFLTRMPWYLDASQLPGFPTEFFRFYDLGWMLIKATAPTPATLVNVIVLPLALLTAWLVYGVLAHISARIVGGRGTLSQTLGCTALASSAHLLGLVAFFPYAATAGVGTWALVCNFHAIRSAHGLSSWRALFASLLPLVFLALFAGLFACVGLASLLPVLGRMGGHAMKISVTRLVRGVLTLDGATIAAHLESPGALRRGLLIMAAVALFAGLVPFLGAAVTGPPSPDLDASEKQFVRNVEQVMQYNPMWSDPLFQSTFLDNMHEAFSIAREIAALPYNVAAAPRALRNVLQVFGSWVSLPFTWFAGWAAYALWVMLTVRLLGGTATLHEQLAATVLWAVPHLLDVVVGAIDWVGRLPGATLVTAPLGLLVGLVASIWGLAVYVKGTAVANRWSVGRALLAVLLPAIIMLFLLLLAAALVIGLIFASASR